MVACQFVRRWCEWTHEEQGQPYHPRRAPSNTPQNQALHSTPRVRRESDQITTALPIIFFDLFALQSLRQEGSRGICLDSDGTDSLLTECVKSHHRGEVVLIWTECAGIFFHLNMVDRPHEVKSAARRCN